MISYIFILKSRGGHYLRAQIGQCTIPLCHKVVDMRPRVHSQRGYLADGYGVGQLHFSSSLFFFF